MGLIQQLIHLLVCFFFFFFLGASFTTCNLLHSVILGSSSLNYVLIPSMKEVSDPLKGGKGGRKNIFILLFLLLQLLEVVCTGFKQTWYTLCNKLSIGAKAFCLVKSENVLIYTPASSSISHPPRLCALDAGL